MGDKTEGAAVAEEIGLQPGNGIDVQMVGGFVEQDNIGFAEERLGEQYTTARATGEGREIGGGVQAEAAEHLAGIAQMLLVVRLVMVGADDVDHAAQQMHGHLLGQARHPQVGGADDLAGIRGRFPGENAEQGTLPGAVGAEQAHPVAALQVEFHAIEQRLAAEGEADVLEAE
jgi:hypothetical protein